MTFILRNIKNSKNCIWQSEALEIEHWVSMGNTSSIDRLKGVQGSWAKGDMAGMLSHMDPAVVIKHSTAPSASMGGALSKNNRGHGPVILACPAVTGFLLF